ncbi:MAG: transglycosylase SLT domain-containing protein [Nitrospinae bacterium]|nr:transglycosylase SLT domain-containing protein [Nitrospinota bacterium]
MRGRRGRVLFSFFLIHLFFVLIASGISYAEEGSDVELFPFSKELESRIAFWTKIFTEYDGHQVVIHDAENLDIVYEVVDFRTVFGDRTTNEAAKDRLIEQVKATYRDILRRMSTGSIDPSALSEREYRVHQLFQAVQDKNILLRAAENLRSQPGQRNRFLQGLLTSGRYNDALKEIFRNHDLPEELIAIPHIESNFNYRAYSKKGAAGAWQFIRSTGQLFLKIDSKVDERLDPLFAGQAAARLLKRNYEVLGSWPLAITAYNHGRQGMANAVKETGSDSLVEIIEHYQGPNFGFASKNFYAEFLAARDVIKNYRHYFGEVELLPPLEHEMVQISRPAGLKTILRHFGISREELKEYNPALRPPVLEARSPVPAGFLLRLPKGKSDQLSTFLAQVNSDGSSSEGKIAKVRSKASRYRVKRGDTLRAVALQFDTNIQTLRLLNGLKKSGAIRAGQLLRLPTGVRAKAEGLWVIPASAKYVEEEEEEEDGQLASANSPKGKKGRVLAQDKKGRGKARIAAQPEKKGNGQKATKVRSSKSRGTSHRIKKARANGDEKGSSLRKGSLKKKKKASNRKGKGLTLRKPSRRDL